MATITEYEEFVKDLQSDNKPSLDKLSRFLRVVRELRLRNNQDAVVRYGSQLLKHHRHGLSEEELWLVHEQVAIAALDVGMFNQAATLIRAVAKRFPDSMRMKRLKGMYWEAQGKYEQAEEIYKDMLKDQPTNETAAKRMVAMEKSRDNLQAAVDVLRKYLEIQACDREAWEELGELYLELHMFRQAAFCYEELLLHTPTSVPYLLRYADILYTMGGNSALRTARTYYAKAIELTGGSSARALFGVLQCTSAITDKVVLQDSRTRAQIELPDLAVQALLKLYRQQAPAGCSKLVESVIESSGLAGDS